MPTDSADLYRNQLARVSRPWVVGSFECGRDQRFFLAEANPRISNCRTAAARFGILALNRKSSIAAISSADRKTCRRSVLSGFRGVIGGPL